MQGLFPGSTQCWVLSRSQKVHLLLSTCRKSLKPEGLQSGKHVYDSWNILWAAVRGWCRGPLCMTGPGNTFSLRYKGNKNIY